MFVKRGEGYQRAVAYFDELIAARGGRGPRRLPPIAEVARRIGVSAGTVWKVAKEYERRGCITLRQRRGMYVIGGATERACAQPRRTPAESGTWKWQRVRARLARDLSTSADGERLETFTTKELCRRYSVTYRTMRKALRSLAAEGLLEEVGRGYRPPSPAPRSSVSSRIMLILRGHDGGGALMATERTGVVMREVERRCNEAGVELDIRCLHYRGTTVEIPQPLEEELSPSGARGGVVLGYVLLTGALPGVTVRTLVRRMHATGRPFGVVDEAHVVQPLPGGMSPERARFFTLGLGEQCGQDMAQFLLRHGHRRIAFFSFFHGASWSGNRLAGFRRTFACAGSPHGVELYACNRTIADTYDSGLTQRVMKALQAFIPSMHVLYRGDFFGDRTLRFPFSHIQTMLSLANMRKEAYRLFARAIEDTSLTAWIGSSDSMALLALDFLLKRGMRVPDDISVVGFDDTTEAFVERLTSYNFNGPAIARAIVTHILSPSRRPQQRGIAVRELEGFVARRRSSGCARTASAGVKQAQRERTTSREGRPARYRRYEP